MLALAAGIVAIVLVLGVKDDSATKSDLDQLRDEVAGVEQSASQAAEDDVAALGDRVSQLESQIQSLRSDQTATDREISVLQDDIDGSPRRRLGARVRRHGRQLGRRRSGGGSSGQ